MKHWTFRDWLWVVGMAGMVVAIGVQIFFLAAHR